MICHNISVKDGVLHFAGQNTVALAAQYGTPLYLMDEDYIRQQCRAYQSAFARHFGPGSRPLYASKACCFKRLYAIMAEEGMGIDVVSSGEMYTAIQAGYDLENAYFHSNNKTDADIAFGMAHGIGCFVADNREELHNGLKFFRILTENLTNFFKDIADAFDHFVDRWKAFSVDNLWERVKG